MEILKAENVIFSYNGKKNAVNGVSFSVQSGEYLALLGHNGSGKSTLAKLFNGILSLTSGEITVDGLKISEKQNLFEIRKRVGLIFQNPDNQLVASIIEDDVAFGPENVGIERKEIGERIDFALSAVEMQSFRKSSTEMLSGGQKQRIAIAGVLALKPKILILDESTSMLDPIGRKEVLKVVKKLNEQGVTVIAITHYMDEVIDADRVIVLNEGEIAMQGTPREIFKKEKELKELGLELPLSSYVAQKLKDSGLNIDSVLTADELVEALCKLK